MGAPAYTAGPSMKSLWPTEPECVKEEDEAMGPLTILRSGGISDMGGTRLNSERGN